MEDGGISIVVDGGITELDPAGDRLLVDISGFADEWLHPLSRPKSRRVNRKGRAIAARDSPLWHASISEDRPISGARVCPLCPRKRTNSRECSACPLSANTGNDKAYSITSSARPSSIGGTSRPIAFAALRLITSSNLVGCSTANSPGLAPLRILSTYTATRSNDALRLGP